MDILHPPDAADLSRRRKAAMVVQMLIGHGGSLSLARLPEPLQLALTEELGALSLVDRATVSAVAEEFTAALESVGLRAPGSHDAAIEALADHLSPPLAERLRRQLRSVREGDHWPQIIALDHARLVRLLTNESIEVGAVALSKLAVSEAAAVLAKIPGERARRITYAMSQTADVAPDTVRRIGRALAETYGHPPDVAFEKPPVQRLGAILNQSTNDTREDVLDGLDATDQIFADDVRRAIFTFKDIATRVKPTDIPSCIRSVDAQTLSTAVTAALASEPAFVTSAEFILDSISQRMAAQIREEGEDLGRIKRSTGEAAMAEVTKAIREMADSGVITLIDPDEDDMDEA